MTNREYKTAREQAENAAELFEFEHYNGWYLSRNLTADDLREMRAEIRTAEKSGGYVLDGFGGRAVIVPNEHGATLQSYNTYVCEISGGKFRKLWGGYSATTMKHINLFREYYGFPKLSKREWIELDA